MRYAALVCGLSHSYARAVGKAVGVRNDQHKQVIGEEYKASPTKREQGGSCKKVTANLKSNRTEQILRIRITKAISVLDRQVDTGIIFCRSLD